MVLLISSKDTKKVTKSARLRRRRLATIGKFDDDFRFKLTKKEYENILRSKKLTLELDVTHRESEYNTIDSNLRSKNLTSSWGGTRKLPYVFTEQGIYMLMTVLKKQHGYQN